MKTSVVSIKRFSWLYLKYITILLVAMSLFAYFTDNGNSWKIINMYTYPLLDGRYKFDKFGYGNGFVWIIITNVIQFPVTLTVSLVATLVTCLLTSRCTGADHNA